MQTFYIGLSTSGHDPALAIVDETGNVLFAEATERYLQDKRGWGAAADHAGHLASAFSRLGLGQSDHRFVIATSWSRVKADVDVPVFDALLPASDGLWVRQLQAQAQSGAGASMLRLGLMGQTDPDIRRFDHHLCHATAACYSAPFDSGTCLVLDGEGEVGAVSLFRLSEGRLKRAWRSWGPGSLGVYYAWLTGLCGFDWRAGEEWKVMGLAAFGRANAAAVSQLRSMMTVENGRLVLADKEVLARVTQALARMARAPGAPVLEAADLAAAGQEAYGAMTDDILGACLDGEGDNLILAGGCALNSSYNGTILHRFPVARVHVPPAPADDGNAIGAALLGWLRDHPDRPLPTGRGSPFLGSLPGEATCRLASQNASGLKVEDWGAAAADALAERLAEGKIIGVMRGGAEFGPRALGHRSILADPRRPEMVDELNRKVKRREPYRPFAPVVLAERTAEWFDHPQASPYMGFTLRWRSDVRDRVPAVVHKDGTGRLQTVDPGTNPWMHELVSGFARRTDVPVVLNTSFNVMGKPIVHSVEDALAVLMTSGLDGVLIGNVYFGKPGTSDALRD